MSFYLTKPLKNKYLFVIIPGAHVRQPAIFLPCCFDSADKNRFICNYNSGYNPSTSANWIFLVTGCYNPNSHDILISLETNSWKDYNISFYIPANSIIGFKK